MLLIGSRALKLRCPDAIKRQPKDFDFICTQDEFDEWIEKNAHKVNPTKIYSILDGKKMIVEGDTICEFEIIQPNSSNEMLDKIVREDEDTIHTSMGMVPSFDLLFTIKDSHKYKKFNDGPNHFWKTAIDWHLMKLNGAKIREKYKSFLKLREKETYTYKLPNLNQSKDKFFSNDQVDYKFIHDDLHLSVMLYDRPAYTYYMKDGSEVMSDKGKFFNCSREIQLAGVIEEALTLALERSLISFPGIKTPEQAFRYALSKISTSITSGWFREFTFLNIFEVLKMCPLNYYEKFQDDVKSGLIRPFKSV